MNNTVLYVLNRDDANQNPLHMKTFETILRTKYHYNFVENTLLNLWPMRN
jgi:hypothetical protein